MKRVPVPSLWEYPPSPSGIPTIRYCCPGVPPRSGTLSSTLNRALTWYSPPTGSTYGFTAVAAEPELAPIVTATAAETVALVASPIVFPIVRRISPPRPGLHWVVGAAMARSAIKPLLSDR